MSVNDTYVKIGEFQFHNGTIKTFSGHTIIQCCQISIP